MAVKKGRLSDQLNWNGKMTETTLDKPNPKKFWVTFQNQISDSWFPVLTTFVLTFISMLIFYEKLASHGNIFFSLAILTALVAIWFLKVDFKNRFKSWLFSGNFNLLDVLIVGVLSGISVFFCYFCYKEQWWLFPVPWIVLYMLFLVCRTTQSMCLSTPNAKVKKTISSENYFNIFGSDEPIKKIEEDELDRKEFITEIALHIMNKPDISMVYGINGSWGNGKTSVMNLVFSYLREALNYSFESIEFESWHYREPDKIVFYFLSEIKQKLLKHCRSKTSIVTAMSRISRSLSNVSLGFSLFGFNFDPRSLFDGYNLKEKAKLAEILDKEFYSQLIIFVDDLDRLDRDELVVLFRAVRSLMGLPKIKFVLAYDKNLIMRQLFPNDKTGEMARDYFSKIIQQEFNLSVPAEDTRQKFLRKILKKHKKNDFEQKMTIESFLETNNLSYYIFLLLPTPREIKRIAAATMWVYYLGSVTQGKLRYNLIDLFLLTLIQYRIPTIYYRLQLYSEKIIDLLSNNPAITGNPIHGDPKHYNELIKKLLDNLGEEQTEAGETLLKYLLPTLFYHNDKNKNIVNDNSNNQPLQLLKERRIFHPHVYQTYFQYNQPDSLVELDSFTDALENTKKLSENLNKFLRNYKILLYQKQYWDIFIDSVTRYKISSKIQSIDITEKILLYYAEEIGNKQSNLNSDDIRTYIYRMFVLLSYINKGNKEKFLEILEKIIAESVAYFFCAYLVKATVDPAFFNLTRNVITDIDEKQTQLLNEALLNRFKKKEAKGKIFELRDMDFVALIGWTEIDEEIKDKILDELTVEPEKVFDLLDIFLPVDTYLSGFPPLLHDNKLSQLNKQIPCEQILKSIKDLDLIKKDEKQKLQIKTLKEWNSNE